MFIGIGMGINKGGGKGTPDPYAGFDPDAKIFLNRMTNKPSPERAQLYNDRFIAAKATTWWAKTVALWVHAAHAPLAGRMNWKNDPKFDCIPVNNPAFTIDRGFMGDGVTSYLDTQFNPGVENNPLHSRESSHLWIRSNTDNENAGSLAGFYDGNKGTTINPKDAGTLNRGRFRIHQSGITTANNNTSLSAVGMFLVSRVEASSIVAYRNAVSIPFNSGSQNAVDMTTAGTYRLGSINDTSYRSCEFSGGGIGAGLSQSEVVSLNSWLQVWLTNVGVV